MFFTADVAGWIRNNGKAQKIGLILKHFQQFDFEKLSRLSLFQVEYLFEWLVWYGIVRKVEV